MLNRLFRTLENTPMTLAGWMGCFLGLVLVRTFLENFSSRLPGSIMTSDVQTIIHYSLFYLATLSILIIILHHGTGKPIEKVGRLAIFGFIIVLTPPLIDLFSTSGKGIPMAYLVGTLPEMWNYFITFFTAGSLPGITTGIRIEFAIILITAFAYVRYSGKSMLRSVSTTVATYAALFGCISLPAFLPMERSFGWLLGIEESLLGTHFYRPDVAFTSFVRTYEMYFNGVMSQVWYLLLCLLIPYVYFKIQPKKWLAIFKNSRPERVAHYSLMLTLGIFIADSLGLNSVLSASFLNVTTLCILFISFYAAWMFAVGTNDIVDCDADGLTNTNRPLVTGTLTVSDIKVANVFFLVAAILGGYLAGHAALFMIIVFTAVYYIYSCPPLHLKRFPVINAFCVALATLCAVLAGFYTVSINQSLDALPLGIPLLILLLYTCLANIKDLKDVAGDAQSGVYTLPVIFGETKGKLVVWGLVCIGLLAVLLILREKILLVPTLVACGLSLFFIQKQPFQEKYLFRLYFLYVLALFLLVGM